MTRDSDDLNHPRQGGGGGPQPGRPALFCEQVPLHDARKLLAGGKQAQITLNGKVYTLRLTRQGKLILTK